MCNLVVGAILAVVGVVLVGVSSFVGYGVVPGIVKRMIIDEVALLNETEQFERFERVPFLLTFKVFMFNITNPAEVLAGGIPELREQGPYVYKLNNSRLIGNMEEDILTYRRWESFEFDAEASYPHTEDDMTTIVNVAYHGLLQRAEKLFPFLLFAINQAMTSIFGANDSPIMTVRVRDLLFDGILLCQNPGIVGNVACSQIKTIGQDVQNLEELEDGTIQFTLLSYKQEIPSKEFTVYRGINEPNDLGRMISYDNSAALPYWQNDDGATSVCNTVRGTDSGIFNPFIDRDEPLYAFNTDICRTVELRYQHETEYKDIPTARFAVNEWMFDNNEGCYCLNTTDGITTPDGCLLKGAMELYSCVGAYLVLSYPHFLYADFTYQNGVIGMNPSEEDHRIILDLEPNTGTVIRGFKRAQFNIFQRPITSISGSQTLKTTLMPIFWVEESMELPDEFADMVKDRLLYPLNLVNILVPILIAVSALVAAIGLIIVIKVKCCN
ncbi:sensory neuron membrane protein 2-like [Aricia agestis]|uniref:sensory neuron membrane protein 2-like n=1 Tax=Aricia agestis TaxID=91739 RepID=UPI001C20B7D1|nr:sensory neuron membrane protein 2-like [Aricia agestis]